MHLKVVEKVTLCNKGSTCRYEQAEMCADLQISPYTIPQQQFDIGFPYLAEDGVMTGCSPHRCEYCPTNRTLDVIVSIECGQGELLSVGEGLEKEQRVVAASWDLTLQEPLIHDSLGAGRK